MKEKSTYPWIQFDANAQKAVCTRCKQEYKIDTIVGMSITEFCRLANAFVELHKNCKEGKKNR